MKFDELYIEIGEFGRYQKIVVNLGCFTSFYAGILFLTSFFVLAIPEHRCAIDGLNNDTYRVQDIYHEALINASIPPSDTAEHKYDRCHRFELAQDGRISRVKCDKWVYDDSIFKSTLGAELNMVCDKAILKSSAQMSFFGGLVLGSVVLGMASDRFGRKPTFCISSIFYFLAALCTTWANNFIVLFVLTFFVGFFSVGNFMTGFVIGMEFVGPTKRRFAGTLGGFYWTAGTLTLAGMGYAIRDWKTLQLVCAAPGIIFQLYWIIYPESPRWLYISGRHNEAKVILEKVARSNNKTLPEKMFESVEMEGEDHAKEEKIWHLFKSKRLCIRTLILFFIWLAVCMAYYGMALNSADLGGDIFLDFFLQAVMDIPAKLLVVFLLNTTGRKFLMVSSLLIGGLGFLATIFVEFFGGNHLHTLNIVFALIGKFGAAAAYPLVYVFSAELFPTVVRNAGMGASSCVSRVGGMAAPYIADLDTFIDNKFGKSLPMIVFGSFCFIGGVLALFLPETLNKPLPETIEEGEHFGRNVKTQKNEGKPAAMNGFSYESTKL